GARSTDRGRTWSTLPFGFQQLNALMIDSQDRVYAGTKSSGVQTSTDAGTTWASLGTGLTNPNIQSLTVTPAGYLVVGSSTGPYRSITPFLPRVSVDPSRADGLHLSITRVGPNPGHGDQRIRYAVDKPGRLRITVYDVAGRVIARSSTWVASAGSYEEP